MTRQDTIVDAFTELAPRYEETFDQELGKLWGLSYVELIAWLIEAASIKEGDRVLDVATGTALIPLTLANKTKSNGRIVGLDITPTMLQYARANIEAKEFFGHISLICASATTIPLSGGSFDIVICGLGAHHMDVYQMLLEMKRVLKPGGKLIMINASAPALWRSFWGVALLKILLFFYGLTHQSARGRTEVKAFSNIRTADEWRTVLSDIGFTQVEMIKSEARRPWYPDALTVWAVAGEN